MKLVLIATGQFENISLAPARYVNTVEHIRELFGEPESDHIGILMIASQNLGHIDAGKNTLRMGI